MLLQLGDLSQINIHLTICICLVNWITRFAPFPQSRQRLLHRIAINLDASHYAQVIGVHVMLFAQHVGQRIILLNLHDWNVRLDN